MHRLLPLLLTFVIAMTAWQSLAVAQCRVATLAGEKIHRHDRYGKTIGVVGDVAMVGAPSYNASPHPTGRVFVFRKGPSPTWSLTDVLDFGELGFGRPLAISGNTAAIGSPWTVRVLEDSAGSWQHVASLSPVNFGATFGQALAIEGARIVVGSPPATAASVYERGPEGTWSEVAQLAPSEGGWLFGYAVAVRGDVIVVGAPNDMSQTTYAGAAFVFERQVDGAWTQTARLLASDPRSLAAFGSAVAIEAGSVLIGAPYAGAGLAGQVYVFQRSDDGTWTQRQILRGDPAPHWIHFGGWMSVDADRVIVGAKWDGAEAPYHGAAYVFARSGADWQRIAKLLPPPEFNPDGGFGEVVALSGGTAIITSGLWDSFAGWQSGEVYVYPVGADSDGDGTMDVCECWSAGDLDLSSAIGLADLVLLLSSFGVDASGDVDMDGVTGLHDLVILLSHFGEACP